MFLEGDQELEESVKFLSKEMEKVGVNGAYDAFKLLRPKAFRTNIWRWMALWYYGGIYVDAKMAFT
jgi:mannosyltransferase OCH1-like enzyme